MTETDSSEVLGQESSQLYPPVCGVLKHEAASSGANQSAQL